MRRRDVLLGAGALGASMEAAAAEGPPLTPEALQRKVARLNRQLHVSEKNTFTLQQRMRAATAYVQHSSCQLFVQLHIAVWVAHNLSLQRTKCEHQADEMEKPLTGKHTQRLWPILTFQHYKANGPAAPTPYPGVVDVLLCRLYQKGIG